MAVSRLRLPIFEQLWRTNQLTSSQRASFLKAIQKKPKNKHHKKTKQTHHPVLQKLWKQDILPRDVLHIWDAYTKKNNTIKDSGFNMVAALSLQAATQLKDFKIASEILSVVENHPHASKIPYEFFSQALFQNGAFRPAFSVLSHMNDLGIYNPSSYYPFFYHFAERRQPLMIMNILRKIFRTRNKKMSIAPINCALESLLRIAGRFSKLQRSNIRHIEKETEEEAEIRIFEEAMAVEELVAPYLEFADDIIDILWFSNIANKKLGTAPILPNATTFKLLLDKKWCVSIDRVDQIVVLLKKFNVTITDPISAHVVRAVVGTEPTLVNFYLNALYPTPSKKMKDPKFPKIPYDRLIFRPKKFTSHHEKHRVEKLRWLNLKEEEKQLWIKEQNMKRQKILKLEIEENGLRLMALGVLGLETYTALIESLAHTCIKVRLGHMSSKINRRQQIAAAIKAWEQMYQQWMFPSKRTLLRLLLGCGAARQPELFWDIWEYLPNHAKYHPQLLQGCFYLIGGADSKRQDSVHLMRCLDVFEKSKKVKNGQPATLHSYNLLLHFLANASQLALAVDVLDQLEAKSMGSSVSVNESTYLSLINSSGEARMNWRLEILYRMLRQGIIPSEKTIDALTMAAIRVRYRISWNVKMMSNDISELDNVIIRFEPRPIGIIYKGNTIVYVEPNSQATIAGVQIGWQILTINGNIQPNNENAINMAIERAKQDRASINIVFCKNGNEKKIPNVNDAEMKTRKTIIDTIENITLNMQKGISHPISLIGT